MGATVTLEPWGSGDLPLLERLMGDPRMTEHLGGPESPEQLGDRQGRYERLAGGDRMFKIVDVASGGDHLICRGGSRCGFASRRRRATRVNRLLSCVRRSCDEGEGGDHAGRKTKSYSRVRH